MVRVVGIRREDKNRWERRVPLTPAQVGTLIANGMRVLVQPSTLRCFPDHEYAKVGAEIVEDLSAANVILCVKEVPEHKLIENKNYAFFSHTMKAQPHNMPLLDALVSKGIRHFDWEKIATEEHGRLVRFGVFAGYCGFVDMLRAIGLRLLVLGHTTPLLHVGYAHMFPSISAIKQAIIALGEEVERVGLPDDICPMVICFTGASGNVARGAMDLFELLPHKYVQPEDLPSLVLGGKSGWSNKCFYGVKASTEDWILPLDEGKTFDKKDYLANPKSYESVFAWKYGQYVSAIVNCVYWDRRYPRMLPTSQVRQMARSRHFRLIAVADITCDPGGSIEFVSRSTSVDNPCCLYDVATGQTFNGIYGKGIVVLAIDNWPSELPVEASEHFGDMILKVVPSLADADTKLPYEELAKTLEPQLLNALVTCDKKLTPRYEYITKWRHDFESKLSHVLMIGSGYVAAPVVQYLSNNPKMRVTIASFLFDQAKELASKYANMAHPIFLNVMDEEELSAQVAAHDCVISLVPATMHIPVARQCIKHKKHLVTASYISPEMKSLDNEVKAAGLTFLNEIGLDPGIDHMSALKVIAELEENGGKIVSFKSMCGALPSPDAANNPLGYKFSWNPRGVLRAGRNPAKYLMNGDIVNVDGDDLYTAASTIEIEPCFSLEMLPNRDSVKYIDIYRLKDLHTMMRGTLRFTGYSQIMEAMGRLGLFSEDPVEYLKEDAEPIYWCDVFLKLLPEGTERTKEAMKKATIDFLDLKSRESISRIISALDWFGFFDIGEPDHPVYAERAGTVVDSLCALMQQGMAFHPHERDMCIMSHHFGVEWPDGTKEIRTSTLVAYGDGKVDGHSALAKTVGIPVAIAVEQVLEKVITRRGVLAPVDADVYGPVLKTLEEHGIRFMENSRPLYD